MSPSRTFKAAMYGALPLPPGTSLSWIPPSSLYCCHRSVSRISAAARKRRMATSPAVGMPLRGEASAAVVSKEPADRDAPATPRPLRKERRLTPLPDGDTAPSPPDWLVSGDAVGTRFSFVMLQLQSFQK